MESHNLNDQLLKLERCIFFIEKHLDSIDQMIVLLRHSLKGSMEQLKEEIEIINKQGDDQDGNCQ